MGCLWLKYTKVCEKAPSYQQLLIKLLKSGQKWLLFVFCLDIINLIINEGGKL